MWISRIQSPDGFLKYGLREESCMVGLCGCMYPDGILVKVVNEGKSQSDNTILIRVKPAGEKVSPRRREDCHYEKTRQD